MKEDDRKDSDLATNHMTAEQHITTATTIRRKHDSNHRNVQFILCTARTHISYTHKSL